MGAGKPYGSRTAAEDVEPDVPMEGKTVVITGGNTGIGYETARVLLSRGANVVLACRSKERGDAAVAALKEATGKDSVRLLVLDLGSLASVRAAAAELKGKPLDILINNAGIMAPKKFKKSADGVELQFAVNHLGHFEFTRLLFPELRASAPSRIVNVSSGAHNMARRELPDHLPPTPEDYGAMTNYGDSKMCNILMASELNKRLEADGVTAYSLHPGVIATELGRNNGTLNFLFYQLGSPFNKSIPQGAATTVYCALSPDAAAGGYHMDCHAAKCRSDGRREDLAAQLWEVSERVIAEVAPAAS